MKRIFTFLCFLLLGNTGIFAQITIKLGSVTEKIYPNNTRICDFQINENLSQSIKQFLLDEAEIKKEILQLHFYGNNMVMFRSAIDYTADSVADFFNNALYLAYQGAEQAENTFRAPAADPCLSSTNIASCGSSYSQTVTLSGSGDAAWASNLCNASPGNEKIYSFTPAETGFYNLVITSASGTFDYLYKSGSCSGSGWNCIGRYSSVGTHAIGTLTAGTTYYFLIDSETDTPTARTHSFYIACPSVPCMNIIHIENCGNTSSKTVSFNGSGDPMWTTNPCASAPGKEQIYSFTPTETAEFNLIVTSASGGYVDYLYQSGSCSEAGWSCISRINASNTTRLIGTLTAGITYYFLLNAESTGTITHSFYIQCGCSSLSQQNCTDDAKPFCTSDSYCFSASVNVAPLSSMGCLNIPRNPAWYWMKIDQPGSLQILIEQKDAAGVGRDVDFIAWGPFNSVEEACVQKNTASCLSYDWGGTFPQGNIVDCCYCTDSKETLHLPNAQHGEVYLLLLTNYDNVPATISFSKTSGTATTNCGIMVEQPLHNGPLCAGDTLKLYAQTSDAIGVVYNWTGPNGFTSNQQNPIILNVTTENAGIYSITISANGQTSEPKIAEVIINTPSDTTFINDNTCINFLPYTKYGFNASQTGEYILNLKNINNCDSVVVLDLTVNEVIYDTVSAVICQGDSVLFNGIYYHTSTNRTDIITSPYSCDSVLTLNLTVNPVLYYEYSHTMCSDESYNFNGMILNSTGTYYYTLQNSFGCDSIITLHLTVNPFLTKTQTATICKLDSYNFYGKILTAAGIYFDTIPAAAGNSCDTIVTLNLIVDICSEIEVLALDEICADDEFFEIYFNILKGDLVCYSVVFEDNAINAGFQNIPCTTPVFNNKLEIPIPQFASPNYVCPNNYKINVEFEFTDGAIYSFQITVPVYYPSWIIQQKWNNVLALLNEYYNGGYKFSAYEWYKNDAKMIPEEKNSYLYLGENKYFDFNSNTEYRVRVVRDEDGVSIFSCPMIPEYQQEGALYPTLADAGHSILIPSKNKGTITIISVSGILVSKEKLATGENIIKVPMVAGFYIMVVEETNKEPIKQVLIVK